MKILYQLFANAININCSYGDDSNNIMCIMQRKTHVVIFSEYLTTEITDRVSNLLLRITAGSHSNAACHRQPATTLPEREV